MPKKAAGRGCSLPEYHKGVTKQTKKSNIRTEKGRAPRPATPKNPRKDPNIFSESRGQAGPFLPEGPAGPVPENYIFPKSDRAGGCPSFLFAAVHSAVKK